MNNLFKILVLPSIKLCINLWSMISTQEQNKYTLFIRKYYRMFMGLPYNCPNDLIHMILHPSISPSVKLNHKTDKITFNSDVKILEFPKGLSTLLKTMYYNKCNEHGTCLNSHHLLEHNISVNPYSLLIDYQTKKYRHTVQKLTYTLNLTIIDLI